VAGCGIDLVETDRMRRALERWGAALRERLFREEEQRYCESRPAPWRHYAGRFAVKEAVAKAFGTGIGADLGWLDILVLRNASTGEPSVTLRGAGGALAARRGIQTIFISLSHTHRMAVAQAILTR
jgi:holo-[acyl-carrier protein] synthase